MNFFRQLFHTKRFGDVRKMVAFQKFPRLRGQNVAGHEQEPLSQRIPRTFQRFIEMLPIETGHFHVADNQVECLGRRARQSLAAIEEHVHEHPFIFEHVGDQAGHGRFILDNEHARAFPGFARRRKPILAARSFRDFGQDVF